MCTACTPRRSPSEPGGPIPGRDHSMGAPHCPTSAGSLRSRTSSTSSHEKPPLPPDVPPSAPPPPVPVALPPPPVEPPPGSQPSRAAMAAAEIILICIRREFPTASCPRKGKAARHVPHRGLDAALRRAGWHATLVTQVAHRVRRPTLAVVAVRIIGTTAPIRCRLRIARSSPANCARSRVHGPRRRRRRTRSAEGSPPRLHQQMRAEFALGCVDAFDLGTAQQPLRHRQAIERRAPAR